MIPFSPPYIDNDIIEAVKETLNSGWITTGKKTIALQEEISNYCGIQNTLCVNSATSGLMIALKWFGIGAGDEVIIPAYTYCATALAVHHLGAKVVMADITGDFNIDPSALDKIITPATKAIIPVDFAGFPCNYDLVYDIVCSPEIKKLFRPDNLVQDKLGRILVLSDAAHSFGATYKGKQSGSLADISVFSFHAVKNITTAEGGAICITLPEDFDNSEVYKRMKLMSLNGQTKDALAKSTDGNWKYDIVLDGYKMNMPDICATIGLTQIHKYRDVILPKRKQIAEHYDRSFRKLEWAILPPLNKEGFESSYHIYPLRIRNISEVQRDEIIKHITAREISVNVHFIPLPLLTFFKDSGYLIQDYPVTYATYASEISLPIYPQLIQSDVDLVIKAVIDTYNEVVKND